VPQTRKERLLDQDIDIRPVHVDRLVTFNDTELESRQARIEELRDEYEKEVSNLRTRLEDAEKVHRFLLAEHELVVLARKLKCGDVVRVVCSSCAGTGVKPDDVTSGRIRTPSAFETVGPAGPPKPDPKSMCSQCEGKKWVLMDRFKG
jgi:molybdopterin converting factor small subunit